MIKKEHNIQVQMFRVKGDIAPFIEVAFMDKYAQEHTGLLLLDSGSTTNILSCEMSSCIGERWKLEDESATISSIAPEDINADIVKLSFALGGRLFHETFSLSTKPLPIKIMDKTVLGLVGVGFMQKYSLVIDYGDFTLHTSQVNHSNLSISDCDFFFPMEIGLKHYSLPVISVKQKGKDHVTLIDTGSTSNMIAEQTLIDSEFECQRLDGNDVMIGITGEVNVKKAIVRFIMLSLH